MVELTCRLCRQPYPLPLPIEWEFKPDIAIGPCCSARQSRFLAWAAHVARLAEGG